MIASFGGGVGEVKREGESDGERGREEAEWGAYK